MRGRRDQVIICTKAGHSRDSLQRFGKFAVPLVKKIVRRWKPLQQTAASAVARRSASRNFEPGYISRCVNSSLRRLNTDYLDLFLLHGPSPQDIADGAVFEALESFKEKGLIRHYGVSCQKTVTTNDASVILEHPGVSNLQISVRPYNTDVIEAIQGKAEKQGVGLVAREIFLKGAIFDDSPLREALAKHHDRSPAQTALQFAFQINAGGPVLVGVTNRKHLAENVEALSKPPLTEADIEELRAL
jgi:2,5-diketo-D-gluconate reductase B